MLAPVKIGWINWESPDLVCLGRGDASLVYRLLPGLVAKVGFIAPAEVKTQQYLAALEKALPIVDYASSTTVSPSICTALCRLHGTRPALATTSRCTCQRPLAVLLMPEATAPHSYTEKQMQAFRQQIVSLCRTHLHRSWEDTPQHLAVYHDHLVALDFGEPEPEDC